VQEYAAMRRLLASPPAPVAAPAPAGPVQPAVPAR
jgi:hypothetical protein